MTKEKKLITKSFTFEGKRYYVRAQTEREAIIKMANKQRDLKEQKMYIKGTLTVAKWCEICFDQYKTNVKEITLKNQKSKANKWIVSEIGNLRLKDIKPLHCQKVMNRMDGCAADTIKKVKQLMNFIFDKAVENEFILTNPAKRLTLPKGGKSTRRAITELEREHVLRVAESDPKFIYFLFMLYCGCRPSEAAEIKGMDIKDIEGVKFLHIRGTKTDNADRNVPIPDYLYQRLPKISPFDYFVPNSKGGKMDEQHRQRLWKRFKRELNISMGCEVYRNQLIPPYPLAPDFTPYCLRHTYCTDLQKRDVDIRTAQYLMGHSDIKLTANIYTHVDIYTLKVAAEKIDAEESQAQQVQQ